MSSHAEPKALSSHLLVTLQFSAIALGLFPIDSQGQLAWLSISAAGVLVGIYTLLHNRLGNFGVYPEPLEHAQLVTTGPYAWVRHPMYLSLLLFMAGVVLYHGSLANLLALPLLLVAIIGKMNSEERYLRKHFEGYSDYCRNSNRLIPYIY